MPTKRKSTKTAIDPIVAAAPPFILPTPEPPRSWLDKWRERQGVIYIGGNIPAEMRPIRKF